ncbi:MAG: hypothetical protein A2Y45_09760 [Tenericutes bacterium GWC2_34_14]|nr:MAG: hypothetical protein A2Z84_03690 [Tenericutes bacterium GWA2_35_7]OHE29628.1 MAG: hypothetical protein A2Y45_09760 [Tenericutes bacterium GWC2_34_14]OHE34208.1 MAG: hypothetical protein A2012_05065 [Tenericutes bacterium GWE2_34_108]OHE35539.1 MAG: hypothetical protein A2Y46_05430 [Tenericutes bacterium GWF1_35_14]OHE38542.1 MAG: hypothetical protein A2Y44_04040 [Tenericutes bacterium GWF2_35_184]OHE41600.1 MAG: hypothetical protein A3K26_08145 [Tenericutes bacterium RIFOXYA12_FULL_35_
MRVLTKILGGFILLGLILAVVGFFMGLEFSSLGAFFSDEESYGEMITVTHSEEINELNVNVETRDVILHYVEETEMTITYYKHETKDTWVFDGTNEGIYSFEQDEKAQLFGVWNFKFTPRELTEVHVYMPSTWVLDLNVESAVGSIKLEQDVTVDLLYVELISHTGSIILENTNVKSLSLHTDTGGIVVTNVVSEEEIGLSSNTGSVTLTNVTGTAISINTDTGSAKLSEVTGTGLIVEVGTGDIKVSNSAFSGNLILDTVTGYIEVSHVTGTSFELDSATGDVIFTASDLSLYRYDLRTTTGDITVDGQDQGTRHSTSTGSILIKVSVDTGDIEIK